MVKDVQRGREIDLCGSLFGAFDQFVCSLLSEVHPRSPRCHLEGMFFWSQAA